MSSTDPALAAPARGAPPDLVVHVGTAPASRTAADLGADPAAMARAHARAPLDVTVQAVAGRAVFTGFSENISEGGIFIATEERLEIGALLLLELHLPSPDHVIRACAEVRWVRPACAADDTAAGVAMQFVGLSREDAGAIREFVSTGAPIFWE